MDGSANAPSISEMLVSRSMLGKPSSLAMDGSANAPSISEMLVSRSMWDKPSLLAMESRYSLSGSTSHSNDSSRGVWRQMQNKVVQNHMAMAHSASNMELPSVTFSKNDSRTGLSLLQEDPRNNRSAYTNYLNTAENFHTFKHMQIGNEIPDLGNRKSHSKVSAGQSMFSSLGSESLPMLNKQRDGQLSGNNVESQASSCVTFQSRKSLLEDLRLLNVLRAVNIPGSSPITLTEYMKNEFQKDNVEDQSTDNLPSWNDVARRARSKTRSISPQKLRSRSPKRPLSISPKRYRSRSPSRYMSRLPKGNRMESRSPNHYGSQSLIQTLSDSRYQEKYRSQSPRKCRSRSPSRHRSISPPRYRSRSPARYRSRSPAKYRSRSPARYRSRSPARYGNRSPARYRSKSPTRYRSRSPARYRNRSPAMYKRGLPSKYRSQSPRNHRSRSPGMHETYGSGRYSRSPTRYRSKSPGAFRSRSSPSNRNRFPSYRDVEVPPANPVNITSPYKLIGALCLIESAISQANTSYALHVIHSDTIMNVYTMSPAAKSSMFFEGFELHLEVVSDHHVSDWKNSLYQLLNVAYERELDLDVYVEARAHDDEMDIRGAQAFELAEYIRGSNVIIAITPIDVWERRVQENKKKNKKKKKKGSGAGQEFMLVMEDKSRHFSVQERLGTRTNVLSRLGDRVNQAQ